MVGPDCRQDCLSPNKKRLAVWCTLFGLGRDAT